MTQKKEIKELLLKNATNQPLTDYETEQLRELASQDSENILGQLSEINEIVQLIPYAENKCDAYKKAESHIQFYLKEFETKIKRTPELINLQSVDMGCHKKPNESDNPRLGNTILELIAKCSINPVLYAKAIRLGAIITPAIEKSFALTAQDKREYLNPVTAHKQINKVNELFLNSNVILNKWIESGKKLTPHEIKAGAARLPKSVQIALFEALKTLQRTK